MSTTNKYGETIRKVEDYLSENLTPHRIRHIKGVAVEARRLACAYGCDMRKAYLAGYLHDCTKYFTDEENERYIGKYSIKVSDGERSLGNALIHSKTGAYFAGERFGVKDKEIFDAIYYHTVGRPHMTLLEKILFVADYIEPGRDQDSFFPLFKLRKLAYRDLDLAVFEILISTMMYLNSLPDTYVCPETQKTLEYYKSLYIC